MRLGGTDSSQRHNCQSLILDCVSSYAVQLRNGTLRFVARGQKRSATGYRFPNLFHASVESPAAMRGDRRTITRLQPEVLKHSSKPAADRRHDLISDLRSRNGIFGLENSFYALTYKTFRHLLFV